MSEDPADHPTGGGAAPPALGGALPYRDTKPQGAADFYFAINATFRFLLRAMGRDGWRRYLETLGQGYYAPVNRQWQVGGLPAVANYWQAFFAAEPGAEVEVVESPGQVELRVTVCPAIAHLRRGGREIVREYCHHCYILGETRAAAAGFAMRLEGGNGSCRQTFATVSECQPPQDLGAIREAC
jgi:hypothetical protein